MGKRETWRVVVALRLSTQAGQRTLQGIYRYLTETRTHWDIRIKRDSDEFGLENVARYPDWGIDGIIFGMCAPDDRLNASVSEIAAQKAPIVAVDVRDQPALDGRRGGVAFVNTDARSAGMEAANFFLRQGGYRSYGYVPDFRGRTWSTLRGAAFADGLKRKGFECARYEHPPLNRDYSGNFRKWIRELRKPTALFVACDDQAITVIEMCRLARLRIPDDVSVLGFDDDELIAESCDPTLSSIRPDHEQQGFIAASRLCALMSGEKDVPRHSELPILNISTRNSTRNESPTGVLVTGAMAYIAKNFRYGIDPAAVARHLNVSRRLLDLRFKEVSGTTVNAAIRDHQLTSVCDMLKRTKDPIDRISELCGFANSNYLKTLFKNRFGMTMRDYRRRNHS